MRIGIPSETKTLEGRVALVPAACADLVVLMVIVGCARVLLGAHFVSDVVVRPAMGVA